MAGLRSKVKQYSSCVLINMDDNLPSITETVTSIIKYIAQKAGIGVNAGALRAEGSAIRSGDAYHTGVVPFYRLIQSAVKSCSQGGVRGGAATLHYPMWHLEYDDIIVLKNNKGTEFNRVRQIDYSVQINGFLLKRLVEGGNITFFSPSDVPGLYDSFFNDQAEFARLYVKYENDPKIRKKTRTALSVFSELINERTETGRVYIMFVDNVNIQSFMNEKTHPVEMSNLCQEITLYTTKLSDSPTDEIALCTLSNINLGKITDTSTPGLYKFMKKYTSLANRALDAILEYQEYPLRAAEYSNKKRRPLGIGVINYAYYLAKNGAKFSDDSGIELTDRTFEAFQYALIESSVQLAREFGPCEFFGDTKYAAGIMPVDRYKKTVDEFNPHVQRLDWDKLRNDVVSIGMRNSCLSAIPPAETSAQISNSTNGIEPVLELITIKESKDGLLKQIVPEVNKLKNVYELRYDMPDCLGYLRLVAVMQKWIDQSISANTHNNPEFYRNHEEIKPEDQGKIPMSIKLRDILLAHRWGVKTLYYDNTKDGMTDEQAVENKDNDCGDACKV
jgi:ribonucleoside-diphosphate reductase alpha chain